MSLVLHYNNLIGQQKTRSWNPVHKKDFPVLVKCYLDVGNSKLKEFKKEFEGRPSFYQMSVYLERLKSTHGKRLRQVMVWDIEAAAIDRERYQKGEYHGRTSKGQYYDTRGACSA